MIRTLLVLGVASAALTLTACDKPSALTKAQPGECYQVVGKDSLGAPTFAKTACAIGGAVDAVQSAVAQTPPAAAGVCAKAPVCEAAPAYIAASAVRSSKAAGHRKVRAQVRSRLAVSNGSAETYEYARVTESDAYSQTASGYSVRSSSSEQSSESYSESGSAFASGYGSGHEIAGGPCCNGPRSAPGPHSPFDQNGFLTWQGKVQYDPRR